MSNLEDRLAKQLADADVYYLFIKEYRFAANYVGPGKGLRDRLKRARLRDWRFDFAAPDLMLAIEIEGGGWVNGRHNRGLGFNNDCIKYSEAMKLGWCVYRCTGDMIKHGYAIETILILIEQLRR